MRRERRERCVPARGRYSLGFVGLGHMGAPMAENLLEHGYELTVFDRDPARAFRFAERGGRLANGLVDIATAETVLLSLPEPREVEEFVLSPEGALPRMAIGSCLVNLSTVSPCLMRRISEVAKALAVAVVDAPVAGAADGAAAGRLTIMVGAERADLARCRPVGRGSRRRLDQVELRISEQRSVDG